MTIANIFDILMLVLLAVVTLRYMRQGFVAGLIQFLGNLLGLIGAAILSPQVADWVFVNFFEGGLTSQLQATISQQGTVDMAALVDKYAGFLPDAMEQSLVESATELLNNGAPNLAHSLVVELIQPLVTPLITVVVFFVCFAICKLLVSFLAAVLTNLNRVPLGRGGHHRQQPVLAQSGRAAGQRGFFPVQQFQSFFVTPRAARSRGGMPRIPSEV